MKKIAVFVSLVVMLLMASAVPVAAKPENEPQVLDPSALFVPDITDVQFESALSTDVATASSLLGITPFWVDLVNKENFQNDGEGVYVAVLDTGLLEPWPFFFSQANIAWELGKGFSHDVYWDDTQGDIVFGELKDDRGFITNEFGSGHGTHVTSTVVGFNYNDLYWINGVAPKATIIPVLVLDTWIVNTPEGFEGLSGGSDEMVSAGIYYIADLAESLDGPVVINMSLGGPDRSEMIENAVNYAIEKGVIVVASAGNEGTAGMGYPGGLEQIISAGAGGWATMFLNGWAADVPEKLNSKDAIGNNWQIYLEDFSSRPNKYLDQKHQDLDVTAPGAWIVGPYKPVFVPPTEIGYYYVSGTSMAAPHVSAMAALLLEEHPELVQAEVERLLELAAAGMPLPASDAIVAFPFIPEGYYWCPWDGGDYGSGFLLTDQIFKVAKSKIKEN